jgi:hypothetical protein
VWVCVCVTGWDLKAKFKGQITTVLTNTVVVTVTVTVTVTDKERVKKGK